MFGTFIDGLIKQQVSTYINQKIGGALDLGKTETSGLADQMIGSLLGGLAHNSKSDTGATSLLNALDKDHDGSILDDLSDIASMENKGQGIVTHIFGNKKAKVTALIAEKTGLDTTTIEQLLTGVAPVLMGESSIPNNLLTSSLKKKIIWIPTLLSLHSSHSWTKMVTVMLIWMT